jgi:S-adenosylmethionine-diacylglycerol 3-amino-3-carboxypropyl transferase
MDFYQHLNFSIGNEDWHVESQALRVKPQDKIICVTASGDRALHLLMTDCAEITAIDLNPSQNFLLELKLAAISHLDFDTYLAFLGCETTPHRQSIFHQLRRHLSSSAAAFWMQHPKMIEKGVIYQGRVERLTRAIATFLNSCEEKH